VKCATLVICLLISTLLVIDELKLWCYVAGKTDYFRVSIPISQSIYELKEIIYTESDRSFTGYDAPDLVLTKVRYHDLHASIDVMNGPCGLFAKRK